MTAQGMKKAFAAAALVMAGALFTTPGSGYLESAEGNALAAKAQDKKTNPPVAPETETQAFHRLLGQASGNTQTQLRYNKWFFNRIFQIVSQGHITKPSPEKLQSLALEGVLKLSGKKTPYKVEDFVEAALDHVMETLDPHSSYISEKEMTDTSWRPAVFTDYEIDKGVLRILNNLPGDPALGQESIKAGDVITHIGGEDVTLMKREDIDKMLADRKDSAVPITIKREGQPAPVFAKAPAVLLAKNPVSFGVFNDVGYIRIGMFNQLAVKKLHEAVDAINRTAPGKIKGYILDLRDNPGGFLGQAVGVADSFLERGTIVSTGDAQGNLDQLSHLAREGDIIKGAPLVVLVNEGSASASEIVAGALQGLGRATIMGAQTYGKGSVQEVFGLDNYFSGRKDGLRMTTRLYYGPSGHTIQNQGVIPDIGVAFNDAAKDKEKPEREADHSHSIKNPRNKGEPPRTKAVCEVGEIPADALVPKRVFSDGRKEIDAASLCAAEYLRGTKRYVLTKPANQAPAPEKKSAGPRFGT